MKHLLTILLFSFVLIPATINASESNSEKATNSITTRTWNEITFNHDDTNVFIKDKTTLHIFDTDATPQSVLSFRKDKTSTMKHLDDYELPKNADFTILEQREENLNGYETLYFKLQINNTNDIAIHRIIKDFEVTVSYYGNPNDLQHFTQLINSIRQEERPE